VALLDHIIAFMLMYAVAARFSWLPSSHSLSQKTINQPFLQRTQRLFPAAFQRSERRLDQTWQKYHPRGVHPVTALPTTMDKSSPLYRSDEPVGGEHASPTMSSSPTLDDANAGQTRQQHRRAERISCTPENIAMCAERLYREGSLVAFPTETVYGLGCHALDPAAINLVFQAKERPASDPLIAHVLCTEHAMPLWEAPPLSLERRILQTLGDSFWPGPLTLVARANTERVPPTLMAHTGYCAVRVPSYPVARSLLQAAYDLAAKDTRHGDYVGCPIAAPSANKFGHVSPTTAQHVFDDLQNENVWILEDDAEHGAEKQAGRVGVESTVAKVEVAASSSGDEQVCTYTITVLRQGAVSASAIAQSLRSTGRFVNVLEKSWEHRDEIANSETSDLIDASADEQSGERYRIVVTSLLDRATKDHVPNVAPGQTIRHYSPNLPSTMLSTKYIDSLQPASANGNASKDGLCELLSHSVVIDYGGRLVLWKERCLAYRDLSFTNDPAEACASLFETLRWAEQIPEAQRIIFPEVQTNRSDEKPDSQIESLALQLALKDRLTRAASGILSDSLLRIAPTQEP
jgi:L-threonylcarbamoyladenylate synthase